MNPRFRLALFAPAVAMWISTGCGDSSTDQCKSFLNFTADCYRKAGQVLQVDELACEPEYRTPLMDAQLSCRAKYADAWCWRIQSANGKSASATDSLRSDLLQLDACVSEAVTISPCKEAIAILAKCGQAIVFTADCIDAQRPVAKCIVDHPASACAAWGGGIKRGDATEFQRCMSGA